MPNSRRRKFLVKHNSNKQPVISKMANECISTNHIDVKVSLSNIATGTNSIIESCINQSELKPSFTDKKTNNKGLNVNLPPTNGTLKSEKVLTTSSSTRDLCYEVNDKSDKNFLENTKSKRRERNARQHRIKIRGPKSNMLSNNCKILETSIGVNTDDLQMLFETSVECIPNAFLKVVGRASESVDDMCRICHGSDTLSQELGDLISACSCRGTVGRVHVRCLERWLTESGKSKCELCGITYITKRVHRYGVPRALLMWILSQNTKQLLVDTLGIMLMSPLAILAAWLSGRTLSTLTSQENHIAPAPWPLASTFVLACMTLVCYYCWIVSAATRHALSWWIWYRSQYEVRLQLNSDCED